MVVIEQAQMNKSIFQSLMQWSREFISPSLMTSENQCLSVKQSENGKGKVYQVPNYHPAALVTYRLAHEDGQGSILLVFYHLKELYNNLEKLILRSAEVGDLAQVELLCKQRRNIKFGCYTHRLQIFRVKQSQKLAWLININFQKPDSYGSGTGVEVIKDVLLSLLERSSHEIDYKDVLDEIVKLDWLKLIHQKAEKAYKVFQGDRLHCMFSISSQTVSPAKQNSPSVGQLHAVQKPRKNKRFKQNKNYPMMALS